jgi:hypothetical protein
MSTKENKKVATFESQLKIEKKFQEKKIHSETQGNIERGLGGRDLISDSPTFASHISARIFLLQLTSDWNSSSSNTFDLT